VRRHGGFFYAAGRKFAALLSGLSQNWVFAVCGELHTTVRPFREFVFLCALASLRDTWFFFRSNPKSLFPAQRRQGAKKFNTKYCQLRWQCKSEVGKPHVVSRYTGLKPINCADQVASPKITTLDIAALVRTF
jgi:hypothetical protein